MNIEEFAKAHVGRTLRFSCGHNGCGGVLSYKIIDEKTVEFCIWKRRNGDRMLVKRKYDAEKYGNMHVYVFLQYKTDAYYIGQFINKEIQPLDVEVGSIYKTHDGFTVKLLEVSEESGYRGAFKGEILEKQMTSHWWNNGVCASWYGQFSLVEKIQ